MAMRVNGIGRLTEDFTAREKGGKDFYTSSLAVRFSREGETYFFDLVCFENCNKVKGLKKGTLVQVEGNLSCKNYTGKDGEQRQGWTIFLSSIKEYEPKKKEEKKDEE